MDALGGTGQLSDRVFEDDVPSCWEDLDEEDFEGCQLGCAAAGGRGGALGALVMAGLLVARRRRWGGER